MMATVDLINAVKDDALVSQIAALAKSEKQQSRLIREAVLKEKSANKKKPIPCAALFLTKSDSGVMSRVDGGGRFAVSHLAAMREWALLQKKHKWQNEKELLLVAVAGATSEMLDLPTVYLVLGFGDSTIATDLPSAATWKGVAVKDLPNRVEFQESGLTTMMVTRLNAALPTPSDGLNPGSGQQEGGNGGGGGDAAKGTFKVGSLLSASGLTAWKIDTFKDAPDSLPHAMPPGTALSALTSRKAPNLAVLFPTKAKATQFVALPGVTSLCAGNVVVVELTVI